MGVVNIKNPSKIVLNEIQKWLKNRGYQYSLCGVTDSVYVHVSSKISQDDLDEFKKEMGHDLYLKCASYGANGNISDFEYGCNHKLLKEFRGCIENWLVNQGGYVYFILFFNSISLKMNKELSSNQIEDFEKEFEVKLREYSVSCNSNEISYKFGSAF